MKRVLPELDENEKPSARYYELEYMKAFHCSPGDWLELSTVRRAELIAHEMERGLRESYEAESWVAEGEETDDGMDRGNTPFSKMRARLGLAPANKVQSVEYKV